MSITRHHNEWLSLVPNSGPFLSLPVLAHVFPQGLNAHDTDHARRMRMAFDEWDDDQLSKRPDPAIYRAWTRLVLAETLGYDELLAEGQAIPQTLKCEIAEYGVTLRPDFVVNDPTTKKARLLVQVYPRSQSLTKPVQASRWNTSPDTRMMQLLHDTGIRLGIVTNGDHWMLVNAPKNETSGYVSWYANLWLEEPITLRAFRTLLCADRLFSVPDSETLEALLDKSANDQQEVTDQLGYQVRKAVEVLIQALDKADQEHGRKLLGDVDERVLYESALTVMMRLVFLFCAEERELLLLGDDLYDKNYAVSTLREQLEAATSEHSEDILGLRYDAWTRLLTTFRAVYAGAKHDRLILPAYGGSLFNPDCFPFLEGRKSGTSWKDTPATPLPISNRTVLHLLEALQVLQVRLPGGGTAEARKLSFRELNIEQIGHVYEGLLDHTAKRATEPVLGLQGTRDKEPEIGLPELEKIAAKGEKELLKFLKDETGRSESALKKALNAKIDDQLVSRFHTACQDFDLWRRVEPFAGLVRPDTNGYPVVVTSGSVFVTGGTDRRSSGTHYTPKSLTEPIVHYTLEPLVYVGPAEGLPKEQWKLRSAQDLLALKICDMACGSGAFLVQACRYLADRLVEAWEQHEADAQPGVQGDLLKERDSHSPPIVRITPYGAPSQGGLLDQLVPLDPDERQTYALRIVAQRCLYGVDKNPLAAEMAKLSLWLLTLAKDKPFEFLDHAIRCGDSLVGISNLDQLRKFDLQPDASGMFNFPGDFDEPVNEALQLRSQIMGMQANTVEDVEAQDRMLRAANEKIERLKCAADMLIGAEFLRWEQHELIADELNDEERAEGEPEGWEPSWARAEKVTEQFRRAARTKAGLLVADYFADSDLETFQDVSAEWLNGQTPFHWPLDFPEVIVERGGFDAFIGNPPFLGGKKITGVLGTDYRNLLVTQIAERRKGSADVCAYFFLRAFELVQCNGGLGLTATSAMSEGDTREVGLDQLAEKGAVIYRATSSHNWIGKASVTIVLIWMRKMRWEGNIHLDDNQVKSITPFLTESGTQLGKPFRLMANHQQSYIGSFLSGIGFILTDSEAQNLIQINPRNKDVLFRYMVGEDLNTHPAQMPRRWVINFHDWPLDSQKDGVVSAKGPPYAADYPECLEIVRAKVKPARDILNRKVYRERWWQFAERCAALYGATRPLKRALAISRVTSHPSIAFVSPSFICSESMTVFPFDGCQHFALLQSSLHQCWARAYSSTSLALLRYSPSDCFDTFPFPTGLTSLTEIGETYELFRRTLMECREEGLTKTYNRFHDPDETSTDIQKLRQLHVEMDNAVAAAYGWPDIDLGHGFHETKQGIRYTISEPARREVLARLLALNHERYAEEVAEGLHDKKGRGARGGGRGKNTKTTELDGPRLFGEQD